MEKQEGGKPMTKAELIRQVAKRAGNTKTAAAQAIDSMTGAITKDMKNGGKIILTGLTTFSMANRKARTGRNPWTGQEIRIPASKTPKFTAGKGLKEAVR
jgi:DNA-binding protein HU-beta